MKKHLCLICTVIIVVLSILLSGCNDGNLSETSSALTSSELTSSVTVSAEQENSEKVNSNVETSSKTSSTQKEETSSESSSKNFSRPAIDKTSSVNSNPPYQEISSEEENKTEFDKYVEQNFTLYPSSTRFTDIAMPIYEESYLDEIVSFLYKYGEKSKSLSELHKKYPVQYIKKRNNYYYIIYAAENKILALFYSENGNLDWSLYPKLMNMKKDFNDIKIGDTYEKVDKISPDMTSYKEASHAPDDGFFSCLFTKDGYFIRFDYVYIGEGEFKSASHKPHPYDNELAVSEITVFPL